MELIGYYSRLRVRVVLWDSWRRCGKKSLQYSKQVEQKVVHLGLEDQKAKLS